MKKILKKIFKKISWNYSEIINKIDEVEERQSYKLIETKQDSQYYLENKLENLNLKLDSINESFYKRQEELNKEQEELNKEQEELNKKIDILSNEYKNKLDIIYKRTNQLDYYNIENNSINLYETNSKKLLIIGFYGAPNVGDELMLETLIKKLVSIENLNITVMLADNPKYDVENYPAIRFIHYPKNIFDFNILAQQYDYFVFGGGAIIDDTNFEKEDAYKYDLGTILIKLSMRAIAFEKKIIALALSASNNIKNKNYIEKLSYIIKNSDYFSVRDENSFNLILKKCDIERNKIDILQDLVLANEVLQEKYDNTDKMNNATKKVNIGIVWISAYENLEELNTLISELNEYYSNKTIKCEINLIPFYDFNNIDIKFYEKTIKNQKYNNVRIMNFFNNIDDITNIFVNQDLIISLRYHGILLSYALGIPCISICYDVHEHYKNKISYLNKIFEGEKNSIDYTKLTKERIFYILDEIENHAIKNKEKNMQLLKNSQLKLENILQKIFENGNIGGNNGKY